MDHYSREVAALRQGPSDVPLTDFSRISLKCRASWMRMDENGIMNATSTEKDHIFCIEISQEIRKLPNTYFYPQKRPLFFSQMARAPR